MVAKDHDYKLHSPSKLVDVGCEVLLDEPPHKVCLGVHFQPLHLMRKMLNNCQFKVKHLRKVKGFNITQSHTNLLKMHTWVISWRNTLAGIS